jgi:hypothetical protein
MQDNFSANLFKQLTEDILANPMRISAHHDMPFAILCYPAIEEMAARKQIRLCAARVGESGNSTVRFLSIAQLFWDSIEEAHGLEKLYEYEKQWGFERTENKLFKLLGSDKHAALQRRLAEAVSQYSSDGDIVFIVRASSLAPRHYRVSTLLESLYRQTKVPCILFYPGVYEGGNSLRFMNMSGESHLASPQYRVKIYGTER